MRVAKNSQRGASPASIEGFLKSGGIVLACNFALGRMVALQTGMADPGCGVS